MPIKVDANSTGFHVGINNNAQEPGKKTIMKYTMINMPLHQENIILHLESQMITQSCLGPLILQQVIPGHWQVWHHIKEILGIAY